MKHLVFIFVFVSGFSASISAADIKDEIRAHVKNIEIAQKKIASLLVLHNFSRNFAENASFDEFKHLYSA